MRQLLTISALFGLLSVVAQAEETKRIDHRFEHPGVMETPDFQKHVVPLLGKLGCNGRACHGSFQGQGGFQLSLFGYDFKMDHEGLVKGDEPRVLIDDPDSSLAIQKPTMEIPHEGGERFQLGSWEHHVLKRWIEAGAKGRENESLTLKTLEVTPAEILFDQADQTRQLKAVAVWSDGTREDVTPLCRFQSNNGTVAAIDESGRVTAGEKGDTHVVVFFDTGVVPIQVIRPMSSLAGDAFPEVAAPTPIDRAVVNKLRKLGIVPSELCSDAEFLRRIRLDLTGSLPTASEAAEFIADTDPRKRARKIDELLETPAYTAWWTTRLCDLTGNNDRELNNIIPTSNRNAVSQGWYDWLYQRVESNMGYDQIMEGIVLGKSREPQEDFETFSKEFSRICQTPNLEGLSERQSMPYFWARNELRRSPETRAIAFAYTFMGIRIQCAQCHKHPFDQWTQDDFKQFTNFFAGVTFGQNPESRSEYNEMIESLGLKSLRGNDQRRKIAELLKEGKTVPFQEVYVNAPKAAADQKTDRKTPPRRNNTPRVPTEAKLLGGESIDLTQFEDPRTPVMDWLRSRDNRFFARAFVNRVWANYFNVGIVDPPDDMSLANPPSNRELLDYLADAFVEHDFDMKWLHREIANSRTYQLSWVPTESNRGDLTNFSHSIPRRLEAEVAYDAIKLATASDRAVELLTASNRNRAIAFAPTTSRANTGMGYALQVFGRSTRDSNCDCDRSSESSLLQTVFLQNDADVLAMIDARDGWLAQAAKSLGSRLESQVSEDATDRREAFAAAQRRLKQKLQQAMKQKQADKVTKIRSEMAELRKRFTAGKPVSDAESEEEERPAQDLQDTDQLIESLIKSTYLRTLSRYPTDDELQRSLEFIRDSDDTVSGIRGLLWALLNTKEFIVNH